MERRIRGAFATPQGLRAWDEWFGAQGVPLSAIARSSETSGYSLSESTLRRVRNGERTDHIERFFGLAGLEPVEGVHFQFSLSTARGIETTVADSASGAVGRFEALSPDEADAAVALSVFEGGWTPESGLAVLGTRLWAQHDRLVRKGAVEARQGRFALDASLASIVERAARRRGIDVRYGEAQARHFLERTLALVPDAQGEISREASEWFTAERGNVLRALRQLWPTDPEAAKTLTESVGALCFRAELYEEGVDFLDPILVAWCEPDDPRYVRCLCHRAKFAHRTFDAGTATRLFRRALRAAERIGDPTAQLDGHSCLSLLGRARHGATGRARSTWRVPRRRSGLRKSTV